MRKLTLPKNPHKGLKIFCKTCRVDNSNCRHYDRQVYRVRIHVPGTKNSSKSFFCPRIILMVFPSTLHIIVGSTYLSSEFNQYFLEKLKELLKFKIIMRECLEF